MGKLEMAETRADDALVADRTTEFEPDVIELLVETLRRGNKRELPVVGTDTLLSELVMGETDAGATIAPGVRKAGALSGVINGRAGFGWVSDDAAEDGSDTSDGWGSAGPTADEREVDSAWREARWRFSLTSRGSAPKSAQREENRELPERTGALRACLLRALRLAREAGTDSVRCAHVARALVELPDTRAREALLLRRLDPAAIATLLDALLAGAPVEAGLESHGVSCLRRAGTLGKRGNPLSRALSSWAYGNSVNGSPVLFAVSVEARRQAVRCGRTTVEPVDLLLGTLALDRALTVVGRSLPEHLRAANAAPALLHQHDVRQDALATAATVTPPEPLPSPEGTRHSPAADRAVALAQLTAGEHGFTTVGTLHLLAALLDESVNETHAQPDRAVVSLLTASGVDVAALRDSVHHHLDA